METRDLVGIPPTREYIQMALRSSANDQARILYFPHSVGLGNECFYIVRITTGELDGHAFTFVGIVLDETTTPTDQIIVGSLDLSANKGKLMTGHTATDRGDLQKLTKHPLP